MAHSIKTSNQLHINPNSQIKSIKLLLILIVNNLTLYLETQYAVVKHVAKKNKGNMIQ